MKTLIKKNKWECLLYSFAMALDLEPAELAFALGHDGSQIVNNLAPEPLGRIGFHVQEMIHVALATGKTVTPFEFIPVSVVAGGTYPIVHGDRKDAFNHLINTERGVLTSQHHAMAFERGLVTNPDDGETFLFLMRDCFERNFRPQCAWVVK